MSRPVVINPAEFHQAFTQFDPNSKGFISDSDVRRVLAKMGLSCTKTQVDDYITKFDKISEYIC